MDRRLYTPPTCTLLIETPTNWLPKISQKIGQFSLTNLANFNFALSFDDPRQTGDSVTVKGDRSLLDRLHLVVNTYIQSLLVAPPQSINTATKIPANTAPPQLQQQGFLTHILYLEALPQTTVSKIDLTTTQLFDLATALDAYTSELHIPTPVNYWWKSKWFSSWGLGATAILVFMGLTSLGFQLLQARNSANSTPEAPLPSRNNSVTSGLQIFSTPKASIPPLPRVSPLGATQKLSPPAPVSPPSGGIATSTPLLVPPERRGSSSLVFPESENPLNLSNNRTELSPNFRQEGRNQGNNPSASASSQNSTLAPVLGSSIAPVSPLPELPDLNPEAVIKLPPQEAPPIRINEDLNISYRNFSNQASQAARRGESLFDHIPQVPEVRKYFQARWQPPLGLDQVLEYSILLNSNGSIAQIIPLGQAAIAYIDRVGIPSLNTPFVSPLVGGENPKIRIVLTPEGGVETFLEFLKKDN